MEIVPRDYVAALEIQSTLLGKIREAQKTEKEIAEIEERQKDFVRMSTTPCGFEDRIYVPNNAEIRKLILREAMTRHTRYTPETPRCIWI